MSVREIRNVRQFEEALSAANTRLVVIKFYADWCDPCRRIAPVFQKMAAENPRVVFLQVGVQVDDVFKSENVDTMPTFIFYRNKVKLFVVLGADAELLERKLSEYTEGEEDENGQASVSVGGHIDLVGLILKDHCECLNENEEHPILGCLTDTDNYLESDCDEQLLISIAFSQSVKVHSLQIKAPPDQGPRSLKLFINLPHTLDFDSAESYTCVQELELSPDELDGRPIGLRFVKFQNVQNFQIFVRTNQEDTDTTVIDHLSFIGSPLQTVNMQDFRRITGKKGESH